jgi:hypothetical protein
LFASILLVTLAATAFADTIKLKDGNVIHGQVVAFKDGQFTVLIGNANKGRRSRTIVYVEDVESIEFDSNGGGGSQGNNEEANTPTESPTAQPRPTPTPTPDTSDANPPPSSTQPPAAPTFFTVRVSVRADNTNNGWSNSGLVVRRGQRIRITASGRVSLGNRRYSTPAGDATIKDDNRLMRTEPTGALIAVIGDDNDEFIFVGARREFVAQKDGVLFFGVNEGELSDNSGTYDIVIEAEAGGNTPH